MRSPRTLPRCGLACYLIPVAFPATQKSRAPHLVVLGSSNTDLVIECARVPRPGETLLGGKFTQQAGGKGANQAVAAARAGARVAFIGRHGADDFGRTAKAGLRREGIDVSHFRATSEAPSGVALIILGGKSRENLIAVARSANDAVSAEDVRAAARKIIRADALLAQCEVPLEALEAAAAMARGHHLRFILNPAPARRLPARLLRSVDTLTPNQSEACTLTGERDPSRAARILLKRGCRQVVVTLGTKGVLLADASGQRRIAAPIVQPVDTVGAGDCFTAWLAVGLAAGCDLDTAARRAVAASALAVTRSGAQAAMPSWREV